MSESQKKKLSCLAILLVTFFVFSPVLNHQFLNWDDPTHLTDNSLVTSLTWSNVKEIFYSKVNNTYIPLTILSFAVEHALYQYQPFGYFLTNILLHLGVVAFIYLLALRIGLSWLAAAFGALLFAIHPMHVESVAWITERKDVLYGFLYLASIGQYWNYLVRQRRSHYWFSLILAFLSMLAKPMALTLPFVLMIFEWYGSGKFTVKNLTSKIPFFVVLIPLAAITMVLQQDTLLVNSNPLEAALIALWTFTFYIKQFIWPISLGPIYYLPQPITVMNPEYGLAIIFFCGLCFVLVRFWSHRLFRCASLIFAASIFCVIRVDNLYDFSIVADRFMYLPSFGICLFIGFIVEKAITDVSRSNRFMKAVTGVSISMMFIGLMGLTGKQITLWDHSLAFWNNAENRLPDDDLTLYPHFSSIYSNRGTIYQKSGQSKLALADFNKAIEINPKASSGYTNRGVSHMANHEYEKAILDFDKVIQSNSQNIYAVNNRGLAYRRTGRLDLALKDFNRILSNKPRQHIALTNRGGTFFLLGQNQKALMDLDRALTINPRYALAYKVKSEVLASMNQFQGAINDAKKAKALGYRMSDQFIKSLEMKLSKQ